ncbi:related to peptide-n4-(n-acetyl-beta-d-glucosaminyl) asparaginase amidase N [Rhynchosporium secalis]|uniref:Related to peptide-n4-(N-acetyl-beta-d-glucosaminyl) asparaginase amidase N n=1 Tax=Rhynchosporium secalis TaxID=38038 RepID=A0A1E1M7Q6_RHYSE|nr:related to peptide-n4-(n-acetyl-beta-d-glucosaminyl) asparaginase amidase N [Rhynchosporium secalis]
MFTIKRNISNPSHATNHRGPKSFRITGTVAFTTPPTEKKSLLAQKESSISHGILYPVRSFKAFVLALLASCAVLLWLLTKCVPAIHWQTLASTPTFHLVKDTVPATLASPSANVLEVFQVHQPIHTPSGVLNETVLDDGPSSALPPFSGLLATGSCETLLMEHSFGFSYGKPFVGAYTPPKCKFNRVTMNFTVTSRGRQFDRLALMYFGDTEIWRTSTAEPTTNGIRWEYIKDMSEYLYFWVSPQTLIFDLGNLIDDTHTGVFNSTLTAKFFSSKDTVEPASLIIPISARKGAAKSASVFTLPADNATNTIDFPKNANRAVFSVSACGQAAEEFWWSNVLQSDTETFVPSVGTLYGYSPFREVQVLIDGQIAGVHWPFPVIFTGGVVPGLWKPIVGIDAFDLREHEIDITPFLPVLSDGAEHTFEIRVVGIDDDGKSNGSITKSVGSSWLVTGKIFVWLDADSNSITTGNQPTINIPEPLISLSKTLTQNSTGANETLVYTTDVTRSISISSVVTTNKKTFTSTWTQSLSVTNYGKVVAYGGIQQNNHSTIGRDQSTGGVPYESSYMYPLYANSSYIVQPGGNFTIQGDLMLGLDLTTHGQPVIPTGLQQFAQLPHTSQHASGLSGTTLSTRQNGTAYYSGSPSLGPSTSFGSTSQEFSFRGIGSSGGAPFTELYYRNVDAVNATVVRDFESLFGDEIRSHDVPVKDDGKATWVAVAFSPKAAIGRGFGEPKQLLVQGSGAL